MSNKEKARKELRHAVKEIRELADTLMDVAEEAEHEGKISRSELRQVERRFYWPLLQEATAMMHEYDVSLAGKLAPHLDELKEGTKALKAAKKQLEKADDIVKLATGLLALVISLATMVSGPNVANAAAAAKAIDQIVRAGVAINDDG